MNLRIWILTKIKFCSLEDIKDLELLKSYKIETQKAGDEKSYNFEQNQPELWPNSWHSLQRASRDSPLSQRDLVTSSTSLSSGSPAYLQQNRPWIRSALWCVPVPPREMYKLVVLVHSSLPPNRNRKHYIHLHIQETCFQKKKPDIISLKKWLF